MQITLESLYLQHYSAMESYAYRFFKNRDLAQDAVQETFLIAQTKLDVLLASPAPRGWLFNTLKNVIGNIYKQQKKLKDTVVLREDDQAEDLSPSVLAEYAHTVPEEELRLLIWVYCDGWPYQSIADHLGISLAACKKRIQRARNHMKQALEDPDPPEKKQNERRPRYV